RCRAPAAARRSGRDHRGPRVPSSPSRVPTRARLTMPRITAMDVHDVRFPTSLTGDGSDSVNRGDYSATYVELRTDAADGVVGAGLTFTNGRGNELTCAAVRAFERHVVGRATEEL